MQFSANDGRLAAPAASLFVRKCTAAIAVLFHADVWVVRAIWDHCCT